MAWTQRRLFGVNAYWVRLRLTGVRPIRAAFGDFIQLTNSEQSVYVSNLQEQNGQLIPTGPNRNRIILSEFGSSGLNNDAIIYIAQHRRLSNGTPVPVGITDIPITVTGAGNTRNTMINVEYWDDNVWRSFGTYFDDTANIGTFQRSASIRLGPPEIDAPDISQSFDGAVVVDTKLMPPGIASPMYDVERKLATETAWGNTERYAGFPEDPLDQRVLADSFKYFYYNPTVAGLHDFRVRAINSNGVSAWVEDSLDVSVPPTDVQGFSFVPYWTGTELRYKGTWQVLEHAVSYSLQVDGVDVATTTSTEILYTTVIPNGSRVTLAAVFPNGSKSPVGGGVIIDDAFYLSAPVGIPPQIDLVNTTINTVGLIVRIFDINMPTISVEMDYRINPNDEYQFLDDVILTEYTDDPSNAYVVDDNGLTGFLDTINLFFRGRDLICIDSTYWDVRFRIKYPRTGVGTDMAFAFGEWSNSVKRTIETFGALEPTGNSSIDVRGNDIVIIFGSTGSGLIDIQPQTKAGLSRFPYAVYRVGIHTILKIFDLTPGVDYEITFVDTTFRATIPPSNRWSQQIEVVRDGD